MANVTFEFKIFAVVTASFAIVNAVAPVTSPVCVAFGELFVIVTAPVPPLKLIPVPATLLVTPVLVIVTAPVADAFVLKPVLVVIDVTPVLI